MQMQNIGWEYPQTGSSVIAMVGTTLRNFIELKQTLERYQRYMAATDLKTLPGWPSGQTGVDLESNMKTAVEGLNEALQDFDATFVERVTGLS